jgi:hypothetical protein
MIDLVQDFPYDEMNVEGAAAKVRTAKAKAEKKKLR